MNKNEVASSLEELRKVRGSEAEAVFKKVMGERLVEDLRHLLVDSLNPNEVMETLISARKNYEILEVLDEKDAELLTLLGRIIQEEKLAKKAYQEPRLGGAGA